MITRSIGSRAVAASVVLLGQANLGSAAEGLRARAELSAPTIVVGEPLVMRVGVTNETDEFVYAQPFLRTGPHYEIAITNAAGRLVQTLEPPGCVVHVSLGHLDLVHEYRFRSFLSPGETITHQITRVLLDANDGEQFLAAGEYRVAVKLGWDDEQVVADSVPLTVAEMPAGKATIYDLYSPRLASLLEGQWRSPFAVSNIPAKTGPGPNPVREFDEHVVDVVRRLQNDFPATPLLKHLEFRQLPVLAESRDYIEAATMYLKKHPDTPYEDVVLYRLAMAHAQLGECRAAVRMLAELRAKHGDSINARDGQDVVEEGVGFWWKAAEHVVSN